MVLILASSLEHVVFVCVMNKGNLICLRQLFTYTARLIIS